MVSASLSHLVRDPQRRMPPKSLDLQRDALRAACNGEDERGRETPFVVFYSGRWLYVSYNCCAMRSRDPRHRVAAGYNTCASGGSRLEPAPGGPGFHLSARRQTTPWAAQRLAFSFGRHLASCSLPVPLSLPRDSGGRRNVTVSFSLGGARFYGSHSLCDNLGELIKLGHDRHEVSDVR